ncbi:hypothetical protein J6590_061476 [Homalodisca vitripennis]|nr:hypothetical protein J6590_061476 [Homalodisca vitripennis]
MVTLVLLHTVQALLAYIEPVLAPAAIGAAVTSAKSRSPGVRNPTVSGPGPLNPTGLLGTIIGLPIHLEDYEEHCVSQSSCYHRTFPFPGKLHSEARRQRGRYLLSLKWTEKTAPGPQKAGDRFRAGTVSGPAVPRRVGPCVCSLNMIQMPRTRLATVAGFTDYSSRCISVIP